MRSSSEHSYIRGTITDYSKVNSNTSIIVDFFDAIYTNNLAKVKHCLANPIIKEQLNTLTLAEIGNTNIAPYTLSLTPLIMALKQLSMYNGDIQQGMKIVELLLEAGANSNQALDVKLPLYEEDVLKYSPLYIALNLNCITSKQKKSVLGLLCQYGANANNDAYYCERSGGTSSAKPLDYITSSENDISTAELLIQNGANPHDASPEVQALLPTLFEYLKSFFNFLFASSHSSETHDSLIAQEELTRQRVEAVQEMTQFEEQRREAAKNEEYLLNMKGVDNQERDQNTTDCSVSKIGIFSQTHSETNINQSKNNNTIEQEQEQEQEQETNSPST